MSKIKIAIQNSKFITTFYFLFGFLIFYFYILPLPISAHILKTDGSIGAVLHIDPNDEPAAGDLAGIFLEFKDRENKFNPQNCSCTFSIIEDGKEIYNQPLFQNNTNPNLENASVFFTFPEKNVYQIKIVGKPNSPNAFQTFSLIYDIRVATQHTYSSPIPNYSQGNFVTNFLSVHVIHLIGGFIVLGFLIFVLIRQKFNK